MNKDKKFNLTDPLEQDIAEYLYEYHKGINNAISNKILADIFQLKEEILRQIITKLIVVDLIPIGSCSTKSSGIFYIDTHRELIYEIKKLVKKAKALRLAYYRSLDKELKLFEMAKQNCKLTQPQINRKKIMKVFKKYGRVCKHYREQIATEILEGE